MFCFSSSNDWKQLQKFRNLWSPAEPDHIARKDMIHRSNELFETKESGLYKDICNPMQSKQIPPEVLKTMSHSSKGISLVSNVIESPSLSIADLRDYWNKQLYQQKTLTAIFGHLCSL